MLKSKRMEVKPEKGESFLKGTGRKFSKNKKKWFPDFYIELEKAGISFIPRFMDGQHKKHWKIQQKLLLSILLMIKKSSFLTLMFLFYHHSKVTSIYLGSTAFL